ncbi:MAG: ParA family protein [Zetaproteobacteria bacterium]|nr:MAG: ParA family protein [Zetaproteobacteria bacterium]
MKHENLGPIIAVANQKGGVGKTTTSINLSASLSAMDYRVLLVDLDPQGNSTTGLGIDKGAIHGSTYDLLTAETGLGEIVVCSDFEGLLVAPSDVELTAAEIELIHASRREFRLHDAFSAYHGEPFDYVVIDCPPALNLLTINALTAADRVLITLQTEFLALEGVSQILETLRRVRKRLNPQLTVDGILLTMMDRRNKIAQQVEREVRDYFGAQVYQTVIPRNVRLAEAPSFGVPVLQHDVRSTGAQAYLQAAAELVRREAAMQQVEEEVTV